MWPRPCAAAPDAGSARGFRAESQRRTDPRRRETPLTSPPDIPIDPAAFRADPYPDLARMRDAGPVVRVPELGALLLTRHSDIAREEKRVEVFSSWQPEGLMTLLMGENMMRKDDPDHAAERKATFPAFSPRTVRDHWRAAFERAAVAILDGLAPRGEADLVADYAMPVAGEALRTITGLLTLDWREMDRVSQAMIDGIANYAGQPEPRARCKAATAAIDRAIDTRLDALRAAPDLSLISVQLQAGLPMESLRANVKLAISGGQNEPRDAIAGAAWALLAHPDQLALVREGAAGWAAAFEEYARWISPIGMSPRRVARDDTVDGVEVAAGSRAFLMFGSGNRDPRAWADPDVFDVTRDTRGSLAFGAGPHFCAGAAASRSLIADVALPLLFERLPGLRLAGEVVFEGWAFRGPVAVPVRWD